MKKWPTCLSFAILVVFILGTVIPARADSDSPITFHVLNVTPAQTIADSPETIKWTGTITNSPCVGIGCSEGSHVDGGGLSLHNNCTGMDCPAQVIYWKAVINATWNSAYSEVPRLNFTPGVVADKMLIPCEGSGTSGTCTYDAKGMILADQISTSTDPNEVHETFAFYYDIYGGAIGGTRMTSINYSIQISTSPIEDVDCASQWLAGTKFATSQINASNATGINMGRLSGWPDPGAWIIIKVSSGTWLNNGTGPSRTDLAVQVGSNPFEPLSMNAGVGCTDSSGNYYLQVSAATYYALRVNDTDGTFVSNTGLLTIDFYYSTYSPFKTGCDANFETGTLIESRTVPVTDSNGITLGTGQGSMLKDLLGVGAENAQRTRYMMLEITTGPHWDGVKYSYASDIYNGQAWYLDQSLPFAKCIVHLDKMDRIRIYFAAPVDITTWKFRAHDSNSSYSDNLGTAGYSLYYVDLLQIYLPGSPSMNCATQYSHEASGTAYTINANTPSGRTITGLTAGNIYAVTTSGGPWYNNGAPTWGVAMSDDGINWDTIYDYLYALCAQATDGNNVTVYFKAMPGKVYRLRVDDISDTFSNNTGTITATVYPAATEIHDWSACSDNYIFTELNIPEASRHVPAQYSVGTPIPYIENGKFYALEITDDHAWRDFPSLLDRYDALISDDGGTTWQTFPEADFATCVVITYEGATSLTTRYRIIFEANGNYYLRVAGNSPLNFPNNTGYLIYKLYEVNATDVPADPGTVPGSSAYIPPDWKTTCYEVCNRPSSLIVWQAVTFGTLGSIQLPLPDVGGWLDFARCAIQRFLSICPEHIKAVLSIRTMFDDREPFGTIIELQQSVQSIQVKLQSLISSGGENGQNYAPYSVIWNSGGGETGSDWGGILPNANGTPWDGTTQLDLTGVSDSDVSGGENYTSSAYYPYCLTAIGSTIGDMSVGFCKTIVFMKKTMNWMFVSVQFIIDLLAIYAAYKYISKKWIDQR